MGVFKRGDTWCTRIIHEGKKIVKAIGPGHKEAVAVQKELELQVAEAKAAGLPWAGLARIQKAKKQPTFKEVAAQYLQSRIRDLKPSSIRSYTDILDCYLLKEFGDTKISQISEERIRKFQDRIVTGRSNCRVNNIMVLLRSIMKQSLKKGLIAENPCLDIPSLKENPTDIDPLTLDELELVLSKIDEYHRPLFTVLAWTGMRPNEARALRWSDIDWRRNQIKICKGRARGTELTESGKQTKYMEGPPKTKSSIRVIPMDAETRRAMEEIQQRGVNNLGGYVFLTKNGQPFDKALDNIWARALKRAELRHRPSYQLRHTWASMALEAGESPAWVSNMLGHETMATTFKYYARYIPNQQNGKLIGQLRTTALTQKLTQTS